MKRECRCHGTSNTCTKTTCWESLASFREIGIKIYQKIGCIQRVKTLKTRTRSGLRSTHLILDTQGSRKPRHKCLVNMKKSPTFCESDHKQHIAGTAGRICNKTAPQDEADSCSVLCCGRGYDTHEIVQKTKCFCQFYWCCTVRCKRCKKHFEITRCK